MDQASEELAGVDFWKRQHGNQTNEPAWSCRSLEAQTAKHPQTHVRRAEPPTLRYEWK